MIANIKFTTLTDIWNKIFKNKYMKNIYFKSLVKFCLGILYY